MARKLYHGSPKKLSRLTPSADGNVYATTAINEAKVYARKRDWKNWPEKPILQGGKPLVDPTTEKFVKLVDPSKGPAKTPWRRTYGYLHEINAANMDAITSQRRTKYVNNMKAISKGAGHDYHKAQRAMYHVPVNDPSSWKGLHATSSRPVQIDKVSRLKYSRKQVPITKGEAAFAAGAVTAGAVGAAYYYRHRNNKIQRVKKFRRI